MTRLGNSDFTLKDLGFLEGTAIYISLPRVREGPYFDLRSICIFK